MDSDWPEGYGQPVRMRGHARDLWTPADGGPPVVMAEDSVEIMATARREILAVNSPSAVDLGHLVGARGGGHSRALLHETLPHAHGTPLYLLLDDFAGASLVAGWIWSRWTDDWWQKMADSGARATAGRGGIMEGICTGFAPGSSALMPDGTSSHTNQSSTVVGPLVNPADPRGWHDLADQAGVAMRRARWIDVWQEGDTLHIDVGFQDSGTAPAGGRIAIHEYRVHATAGADDLLLRSVVADPRILPYPECPGAAANVGRMVGQSLAGMRGEVLATLPGILGCTHLNDVLRGMEDVVTMFRPDKH